MSGIEVAKHLRSKPWGRCVFLIALTGYGQAEGRERTIAAGFNWHLTKPVHSIDLEQAIARIGAP